MRWQADHTQLDILIVEAGKHRRLWPTVVLDDCFRLCTPRSPWQRGTNENTDRLLRQYLPKSADLRRFDQADLDAIACELNHRPRRIHGYRSPAEVYAEHLSSGDALPL